ncbi:MAG: hypothetical protein HZA90_24300 [Verrucomicrobia bacterium]|nr:hypothetical protein [Verrucomicrobiota bacterium]
MEPATIPGKSAARAARSVEPAPFFLCLPERTSFVDLLGVSYARSKTDDGGDLYLTKYGVPFWEHLLPQNWYAREWFEAKRERLTGTSIVYRLPTRTINGRALELVVKWSRVGEDVPMDTLTINKFINAEFNSPFEEFSLLMELREGAHGPPGIRIRTQKPLAIYVPSERLQLWQTGRSESKIAAKLARHPGVELDILRQYVLLYGWIKGADLIEVSRLMQISLDEREQFCARATSLVVHELEAKGYHVVDMKPAHVIVRLKPDGRLVRDRNGQLAYALVDYELMERTPEHEQVVRTVHRRHYLQHMAKRFEVSSAKPMPAHLKPMNVLGVDYVFGHAESTGGSLWVVGKDPDLFNYFLPERWRRTPKEALSSNNQVCRTRTKDNINLVWRVSRVGDTPWLAGAGARSQEIVNYGYNSPFEEFAFALELTKSGVRTTYPRAIYMTGKASTRKIADFQRYAAFRTFTTPDGDPLLLEEREYITIWGFWNGPDELLAARDGQYYRGISAEQAYLEQSISAEMLTELLERAQRRLSRAGFEDLRLKPDHLLISFNPEKKLVHDTMGKVDFRLCNFELLRKVASAEPPRESTKA